MGTHHHHHGHAKGSGAGHAPRAGRLWARLPDRHGAQPWLCRGRGVLRPPCQLGRPARRRRPQSVRRAWPAAGVGRRDAVEARAERALHLRPAAIVDPVGLVQRGVPAGRDRRDRVRGGAPARQSAAGRRRHGDGGRGGRHPGQRHHRLAVRARAQARPQHPRRLPAHGRRRGGVGGRGHFRPADPADRLAVARPGDQPARSSR